MLVHLFAYPLIYLFIHLLFSLQMKNDRRVRDAYAVLWTSEFRSRGWMLNRLRAFHVHLLLKLLHCADFFLFEFKYLENLCLFKFPISLTILLSIQSAVCMSVYPGLTVCVLNPASYFLILNACLYCLTN